MSHKKQSPLHKSRSYAQPCADSAGDRLDLVIKCDTAGCAEAVSEMLIAAVPKGFQLHIIRQGVGAICQNDVAIAETGSKLVIGFNVGVLPHIEELCKLRDIEIRLYELVSKIDEDIKGIIAGFAPMEVREANLGMAKVIALFKSSRGGIILGCEVNKGALRIGADFRVISAMGPVYTGKIKSLHIEKKSVTIARPGQQVGLKIVNFNKAKIGDMVESFQLTELRHAIPWTPKGGVFRH
jgi:translation initiation factor IF-2